MKSEVKNKNMATVKFSVCLIMNEIDKAQQIKDVIKMNTCGLVLIYRLMSF
jgi:hypothetical protein